MKLKNKLLYLAAFMVMVIPLAVLFSTASAMYMSDGAVQHATNGGWQLPTDFVCIVGVHTDGTLDVADGVTNSRDCIYLQTGTMNGGTPFDLTGMTTQAACITAGGAGNDGAKHSWATSFCTKSLKGLDRTQKMCEGIGGTWITTGKCVAYGRQFKGQDANGVPLAFGTKGTVQAPGTGYCYTTLNMTSAGYTATTCPMSDSNTHPNAGFTSSTAYDWAFASSKCTYGKGIAGYLNAALTKADGTTYAAGTFIDLSLYTTMGECIANGGSWNNWVGQAASTTSVATTPQASTIPAWNYVTQAPDADNGCLHCHSSTVEYNGPAEREKDSYLKTGHKNMLRKVTAGIPWAGPDDVMYTQDTLGHAINFGDATVGGGPLYYIFGDWMVVLPDAVGPNGDTTSYSCGACHTTGFNDSTNPGVQAIGTPGYIAAQPAPPYSNNVAAGHKWDLEGIQCSRCHNAAVGKVVDTQIAASAFPTTHPTSGGMGSLANGTGRTNLCFGCHQSPAKNWPAQGGADAGTTQFNPVLVNTGTGHGAVWGRDWNGHVIGDMFLNSPHARYTGTITKNSLGKYDLSDPEGTVQYNSAFQGFTCWQSSTSSSPAKTQADGSEIKTKSDCENLYGAGAWRSDNQGTCVTCHDVHNSMFVADQAEKALRKGCGSCHSDSGYAAAVPGTPQIAKINHPAGTNTPFDTAQYENSCVVCHMAQQQEDDEYNTLSLPAHLWRISTDAAYDTFPTMAQFYGGSCNVHSGAVQNATSTPQVFLSDISSANCTAAGGTWTPVTKDRNAQTAPDGTYTQAVWVDLDLACGQCHGGSAGPNFVRPGAPWINKTELATDAANMHLNSGNNVKPVASMTLDATDRDLVKKGIQVYVGDTISVTDTSTDIDGNLSTITVAWGDGTIRHYFPWRYCNAFLQSEKRQEDNPYCNRFRRSFVKDQSKDHGVASTRGVSSELSKKGGFLAPFFLA